MLFSYVRTYVCTKGAQTWEPQKENNAEQESFILKQTHFRVHGDLQQHGNILTHDVVQCDSFKKWTVNLKLTK
jgi:hypothetical protein